MFTLRIEKKTSYFADQAAVFFMLFCPKTKKFNWFCLTFEFNFTAH